jgi:hypothetical protein
MALDVVLYRLNSYEKIKKTRSRKAKKTTQNE